MNEGIITRWQAEGRGSGAKQTYKPWLEVFDFSSDGNVNRIYSNKLGRTVHLMSTLEAQIFYGLEWQKTVKEIREQYPLDRDITLELASHLGIQHPYYPGTQVPTVMTVDFFVVREIDAVDRLETYDCKTAEDAEDERTIEKLTIVQKYFAGMDIPHRLICDSEIPQQKMRNIEWIRGGTIKPGEEESYPDALLGGVRCMANELEFSKRNSPLWQYCQSFEIRHGLRTGDGLRIAKILMHERILLCDLNNPDLASCPLAAFRFNATSRDHRFAAAR
ncbi:TnsA endonuclease N-terminal domain-containing protein [Paraburkholderia youngii]|uniref:Heteromeric transposase endonuclease subunit TnsA n=1 Tax=Paraburkholderia youngii TaxID=2782701 RepID=A0A7Y6MZ06_9BURK|nr:TnsA endonuclease N-terminal domain-containing protein [Paraburkholderia youngii]NUX99535.1 heteromeric transposase endonuclease subunit TnsA [Paraburkholderia youngii]